MGRKDWEKLSTGWRKCRLLASLRSCPQAMAREMAWCWVLLRWEVLWGWMLDWRWRHGLAMAMATQSLLRFGERLSWGDGVSEVAAGMM
jgi:hypothetical protein